MNDFDYDVMLKKRLVNQSKGQQRARRAHKSVTMPSDFMTKKERERMNGFVEVWKPGEESPTFPIAWNVFKKMSAEHQKDYLGMLQDTYNATLSTIAEMFSIQQSTLSMYAKKLGYEVRKLPRGSLKKAQWRTFVGDDGTAQNPDAETVAETVAEPMVVTDEGTLTKLLALLKGTGARLTIELTL